MNMKYAFKEAAYLILENMYISKKTKDSLVKDFSKMYYDSSIFKDNKIYWMGVSTLKAPTDLWMYQEILYETKPDFIIETGTYRGGSALFLASLCDMMKKGHIITIDIAPEAMPPHKRVTYIKASSTSQETVDKVKKMIGEGSRVMVILDSNHERHHVAKELAIYGELVTKGCYMIVEDTNINGHPVRKNWGEGPWEAEEEFLKANKNFKIDKYRERLFLTFNPNGYLKRVK